MYSFIFLYAGGRENKGGKQNKNLKGRNRTKFWKVEQNLGRWITDDWLPRLGKPGLKSEIDRARNLIKKVSKIRRTRYFRPGNREGRIKKMIRIYWQRN